MQLDRHVTAPHTIGQKIEKRMDTWESRRYEMIVYETLRTCDKYLTAAHIEVYEDQRVKTSHRTVLSGNLQMVVRWITEQEKGGTLQPGENCTKSEKKVLEVLRSKNPGVRPPSADSLESYSGQTMELSPANVTKETVMEIAERLPRGAGPGGTDLVRLQQWLLQFGAASRDLQFTVVEFT